MDDLKHLCNSRKGYHLHLEKLLAKANDLIDRHYNYDKEFDYTTFTDLHDQLQWKDAIISELNSKIVKLITDEDELVDDICEADKLNETLTTAISHVTQVLHSHNNSSEQSDSNTDQSIASTIQ